MTNYKILSKTDDEQERVWFDVGTIEATSAKQAISKFVSALEDGAGGTYVAIPARSWDPQTVTVQQRVTFS